ncbi:MAG: hypothetical protein QXQ69_02535 [Candidatus Aenigmatarchaeota archaeon]
MRKVIFLLFLLFSLSSIIVNVKSAVITDLKAYRTFIPSSNKLVLEWTTPEDAIEYDIRYSLVPIDESNWNYAVKVNVSIVPAPPGTKERVVIGNLTNNTNYYFAIRVKDKFNEWGNLSNIANRSTTPAVLAANGSAKAIQEAVNKIVALGGIGDVFIPEGTWDFLEPGEPWITVTIPAGINIYGAPTEKDERGQVKEWKTVLRLTWDAGKNGSVWFSFEGNADPKKPSRFSDIKLVGYRSINSSSATCHISVEMKSVAHFRIDHCYFENIACGIGAYSAPQHSWSPITSYGVIDHCYLINTHGYPAPYPGTVGYGVHVSRGYGDFWEDDVSKVLGKYNDYTVIIEDSYFEKWRHVVSANSGAHWVFRHNTIKNDFGYGSLDGHGWFQTRYRKPGGGEIDNPSAIYDEKLNVWVCNQTAESYKCDSPLGSTSSVSSYYVTQVGTRAMEIYENQIVDAIQYFWGVSVRGGSGVAFNNIFGNGTYKWFVYLQNECGALGKKCWSYDWWIWNNTMLNDTQEIIKYDPYNQIIEGRDYFRYPPHTFNYTPYTYPHPLTQDIPENYNFTFEQSSPIEISGKITDKQNKPWNTNLIFTKKGILYYNVTTNNEGKYSLSIIPSVYDIFFEVKNFTVDNFWLKMLEVKVNSSSYNSLIYITKSTENKSISLTFNITTNQTIKMYSSEKPKRVLKNSVEILSEQDSLESLVANYGWFYNSSTKILYIKFN